MAPSSHPPVMLIDGYNIIGTWRSLKIVCDRDGLEEARKELVETLATYSAFHGYHTTLVFDAYSQATPAVTDKITKNLKLHFTEHNQTADSYIERMCGEFHRHPLKHLKRIIVVTSDRAPQLIAQGYGAEWMSSQQLEHEVEAAFRSVRNRLKPQKASSKRFLDSYLDAETKKRLEQLRKGLE